jgi:hypothetical protein
MNSKAYHIIILSICIATIAACYAFTLNDIGVHFFGIKWPLHCFLKHTFGISCAFCGMTRSFTSLAHGQLNQAINFHPLGPVLFTFIALQIPYRIWALIKFPKRISPILRKLNKYALALTIIAILINWLYHLPADLFK